MEIIRQLFNEIFTLEEWIRSIDVNKELGNRLIIPDDSKGFIQFMKSTIVAFPQNAKRLPLPVSSFKQLSYQREVIVRVIERIRRCEGTGKNILTFGFGSMSENPDAQISSTPNIEYRYPNSIVNRLHYGVWNKLLTRIGDTVMEYLLENTFIFMFVSPSCYIQITGKPSYELWPFQSGMKMSLNLANTPVTKYKREAFMKKFGKFCNQNKKKYIKNKADSTGLQGRFTMLKRKRLGDQDQQITKRLCDQVEGLSEQPYNTEQSVRQVEYSDTHPCDQVEQWTKPLYNQDKQSIKLPCEHWTKHLYDQDKQAIKLSCDQEKQTSVLLSKELNNYQVQQKKDLLQYEASGRPYKRKFVKEDGTLCTENKRPRTDHKNDQTVNICVYDKLTHYQLSNNEPSDHILEDNQAVAKSNHAVAMNDQAVDMDDQAGAIDDQAIAIDDQAVAMEDQAVAMDDQVVNRDTDLRKNPCGVTDEMPIESENEILQNNKKELPNGTRKKQRKRNEKSEIQDFTPFVFRTYFTRISMLYSKVLFERLPKNFKRTDPGELYKDIFCSEDICGSLKTKIHVKSENCSSILDKDIASGTCQKPMNESVTFKEPVSLLHNPITKYVTLHTKDSTLDIRQQPIGKGVTYEESVTQPINTDVIQTTVRVDDQFCDRTCTDLSDNNNQAQTCQISKEVKIGENNKCELSRPQDSSDAGSVGPIFEDLQSEVLSSVHIDFMPELIPILESFLAKCRKCPYKTLLNRHCDNKTDGIQRKMAANNRKYSTVPIYRRSNMKGDRLSYRWTSGHDSLDVTRNKSPSVRHLLSQFIPHRQVYLFLRLVCLMVVPEELWGLQHNRNIFLKNVEKIISLGKYDKFCLGQLMHGVKTKGVRWLRSVKSNCSKIHMMAKVCYWLMKHFIMVILKSFFYITETTQHRNRLFYYRKKTWNILHCLGLSELKQKQMLKPLSQVEIKHFSVKSLGIASLRFLPKKKSLRPIINLGQQPSQTLKQTLPINKQLLNLHHVITFIKNELPQLLGSAKFGTSEIYLSWKPFKMKWEMNHRKPLYFVKTDVINCYDNIRQEKLYNIMEEIFKQFGCEEFVVRKFTSIYQAIGNLKRTFHRKVLKMMDYNPDFFLYMKDVSFKEKFRNAVIVDQVVNQHERTDNLLQQLKSHLFYNLIKIGKQYYRQTQGISQGSVLSTLLCNLYYGHMEREMFSFHDDELLLRVVDDFLFVTPDKDRAVVFLNQMATGNEEYNCYVNADKILINFHYIHDKCGKIPCINNTDWFPWCGMLFNTKTLNVSTDFSRYSGVCVADTMTYDLASNPGWSMKNKLMFSLRPKCHSMFLDSELNQEDVIITNCYKLFLLTAYKFHVYAVKLPHKQRTEDNPGFFFNMIVELANFFYSQTKICKTNKVTMVFVLDKDTLQWLCVRAFQFKLQKHHSQYNTLLKSLKALQSGLERRHQNKDVGLCDKLRELCNGLPSDFEDIPS